MESVYVETSVISYLAAHTSREFVVAAHQAVGWEWWQTAHNRHVLYISQAVVNEIQIGQPEQVRRRLALVDGLPVLPYTADVFELLGYYQQKLGLTGAALADIPHFAFAVAANVNFLATWNCKHIANSVVLGRLRILNEAVGRKTPLVGTPDILLATEEGDSP